jgi:hypothetical protein
MYGSPVRAAKATMPRRKRQSGWTRANRNARFQKQHEGEGREDRARMATLQNAEVDNIVRSQGPTFTGPMDGERPPIPNGMARLFGCPELGFST